MPFNFENVMNIFPLPSGYRMSSDYGPREAPIEGASTNHKGIDYAISQGTPIYAVNEGEVIRSNYSSSYGNIVSVKHEEGYITNYAHNYENFVKVGDTVSQGQVIGAVGSTGRSTGPHLHFEVSKDGTFIDPEIYLNQLNNQEEGFINTFWNAADNIASQGQIKSTTTKITGSIMDSIDKLFLPLAIGLVALIIFKK